MEDVEEELKHLKPTGADRLELIEYMNSTVALEIVDELIKNEKTLYQEIKLHVHASGKLFCRSMLP